MICSLFSAASVIHFNSISVLLKQRRSTYKDTVDMIAGAKIRIETFQQTAKPHPNLLKIAASNILNFESLLIAL